MEVDLHLAENIRYVFNFEDRHNRGMCDEQVTRLNHGFLANRVTTRDVSGQNQFRCPEHVTEVQRVNQSIALVVEDTECNEDLALYALNELEPDQYR